MAVFITMPVVAVTIPFARHEHWIGRIAFVALAGATVTLWMILIVGFARIAGARWRNLKRHHPEYRTPRQRLP